MGGGGGMIFNANGNGQLMRIQNGDPTNNQQIIQIIQSNPGAPMQVLQATSNSLVAMASFSQLNSSP